MTSYDNIESYIDDSLIIISDDEGQESVLIKVPSQDSLPIMVVRKKARAFFDESSSSSSSSSSSRDLPRGSSIDLSEGSPYSSSEYNSEITDLSYNFIDVTAAAAASAAAAVPALECTVYEVFDSDVALARRKRTFCQNVQMWILCRFEYYKRVYIGLDCQPYFCWCCGCLYWGLRRNPTV